MLPRILLLFLYASCLALPACQLETTSGRDATSSADDSLAVFIGSRARNSTFREERMGPDGEHLFVLDAPLLTMRDFAGAARTKDNENRPAILIELNANGVRRLQSQTHEYLNNFLVFDWNGRVVYAPIARTPLGSKLLIVAGTTGLPEAEVDPMIEAVNAHR